MADNSKWPAPGREAAVGPADERRAETSRREPRRDSHALAPGTRIGRYELIDVLGEGGFGVTYQARDHELRRDVAVKEYLPAGFSVRQADGTVLARSTQTADTFLWGRERFVEEARTLARLEKAAGIVNVYDILSANGTAYMVMEFVQGETLQTRLNWDGRLDPATIDRILEPLLEGLEQVHQAGFLHRDIKPANILIGQKGQPTLIDFGASRAALQGRTQMLTAVYTPGYAAFEQFTSAKQGPWTDIYALGATLYHCVTGAPPPSAADRMREDTLVPAVEAGKSRYAPSLLAAIDAALKLRESERPQSIAGWRRMLASAPPNTVPRQRREGRGRNDMGLAAWRRRWRLGAAGAAVLLCLAGGGWYVWQLAQEQARIEDQAWARAKAAGTVAAYRVFLDDHPSGRFAAEARDAIAALQRQQADAERRAEDDAWATAKAGNTTSSLQAYLDRYPSGRYAAEARSLIAEIQRRARAPQPRDCPQCPEMVRIPPGSFTMGSPTGETGRYADEEPQHRVTIGYAFSLGKYEVTRGEFAAFVQATRHQAAGSWRDPGFSQTDRDPVVNVGWDDARAYVAWLSRTTGKTYRLPSEAEWEYAARAGTAAVRYWDDRHQEACRYANISDDAHGCRDGYAKTAPAGKFQANQFGLYDMLGNVSEWTEDCWNETYGGAPADGSSWQRGDCNRRVLRGGSWGDGPRSIRVAHRSSSTTSRGHFDFLGFRVARID